MRENRGPRKRVKFACERATQKDWAWAQQRGKLRKERAGERSKERIECGEEWYDRAGGGVLLVKGGQTGGQRADEREGDK